MTESNLTRAAADALRNGRYKDVAALTERLSSTPIELAVMAVEADYYLGRFERVYAECGRLLSSNLAPAHTARCGLVLGSLLCDDGEIDKGLAHCRQALELSERCGDACVVCLAAAKLLELTCDKSGFSASLPLATLARKAAVKSGDPQVVAAVHLTCGRLEGRAGHFETAHRHFALARVLLEGSPNLRLSAVLSHDEACVLYINGDIERSLELTDIGGRLSGESGYARGIVVAASNRAQLFAALGKFEEAERELRLVEHLGGRFANLEAARASTLAQIAVHMENYQRAATFLSEHSQSGKALALWYELEVQLTKARLLSKQENWIDALATAEDGMARAKDAGIDTLGASFSFVVTEARMQLGHRVEPNGFVGTRNQDKWPAALHGAYRALLSKVLAKEGLIPRSVRFARQAYRIFDATGLVAEATQVKVSSLQLPNTDVETISLDAAGLDTAATVLDLSPYPQVTASEVLAVLERSGCLEAFALIAMSSDRKRVIQARGWSEREALALAATQAQVEEIPLGECNGEAWFILARLVPGFEKHCTFAAVQKLARAATDLNRLRRQEQRRSALWPAEAFETDANAIWVSEQMSEVMTIARRIAPTMLPMLLTGDTGTGKEVLAQTIHRASDRADKTFLPFNCSAVPRDMIESQLFGYKKGAFTGADSSFQGVIRSAAGGTLFLDEIADIGIELQPKLLRFLETNEIHPLGEPQPVKVDVRVIAATNANLDQLVAEGRFREDLFYRLNVVRLKLPPLRERREEIPALVQHYLRKFADEQRKGHLSVSDETLEYLLLYAWPGNVRQLANEVRRMVAMAEIDSTLTPAQLSPAIQATRRTIPADAVMPPTEPEIRVRLNQPLPDAVEMLEQSLIRHALQKSGGRVEEAARILGISRKGLFLKRRRWNLDQRQAS